MTDLITVADLRKTFRAEGRSVAAADGVSFSIARGETLALVGESGSGKSTTARLILRLVRPDGGHISYDGSDVLSLAGQDLKAFRRRAQMVFQDPYASLDPKLTVGQIIAEPLIIHRLASGRRKERVAELLDLVGLEADVAKRRPKAFSGGQRQRIGIARALAVEPEFLALDEPVSALDMSVQADLLNLLDRLQRRFGLTYLFISHDIGVVRHVADRVAVMQAGALVEIGAAEEVLSAPRHPYTQGLMASVPKVPDTRPPGIGIWAQAVSKSESRAADR
ncbi:MAG: ATP-binding cassette domain-containing protein [Alphaproteobacteria bacterium]|nr:ATP-binding cassette domain-containing protein [Alphaproteobacteria bacterium]